MHSIADAYAIHEYLDDVCESVIQSKHNPNGGLEALGHLMITNRKMIDEHPKYTKLFNGVLRAAGKWIVAAVPREPSPLTVADTLRRVIELQTASKEEKEEKEDKKTGDEEPHEIFTEVKDINTGNPIITASIYGSENETTITLPSYAPTEYTYDEVYGLPDGSLQLVAKDANQTIPSDWKRYEVDVVAYDHMAIYLKTVEIPHGIYEVRGWGEKSVNLRKFI